MIAIVDGGGGGGDSRLLTGGGGGVIAIVDGGGEIMERIISAGEAGAFPRGGHCLPQPPRRHAPVD